MASGKDPSQNKTASQIRFLELLFIKKFKFMEANKVYCINSSKKHE